MLKTVRHWFRVRAAVRREKKKEKARSPLWTAFRDGWKAVHPRCATCGSEDHIQVHHVVPFHLEPSKELDAHNVLTLCMGPNECHLRIGHGDDFRAFNPHVRAHVALLVHAPNVRPEVEVDAKKARVYGLTKTGGVRIL